MALRIECAKKSVEAMAKSVPRKKREGARRGAGDKPGPPQGHWIGLNNISKQNKMRHCQCQAKIEHQIIALLVAI